MKRSLHVASYFALSMLVLSTPVHASRIPETPDGGTEPGVHEIYNSRYGTAYASPAELDVMRVHDMDFFAVPEGHHANDSENPGLTQASDARSETGLSRGFSQRLGGLGTVHALGPRDACPAWCRRFAAVSRGARGLGIIAVWKNHIPNMCGVHC